MSVLLSLGISIGLLAGGWTILSVTLALSTYAGFAAWASYFAAGGGTKGLRDALLGNVSGVIWGMIIVWLMGLLDPMLGSTMALAVGVVIGAFGMCIQANISQLSFIPGAFIGCAIYFATGDPMVAIIGLVSGALFGFVSDKAAALMRNEKAEA